MGWRSEDRGVDDNSGPQSLGHGMARRMKRLSRVESRELSRRGNYFVSRVYLPGGLLHVIQYQHGFRYSVHAVSAVFAYAVSICTVLCIPFSLRYNISFLIESKSQIIKT